MHIKFLLAKSEAAGDVEQFRQDMLAHIKRLCEMTRDKQCRETSVKGNARLAGEISVYSALGEFLQGVEIVNQAGETK